jgi:hypothetical protein
VGPKHPVECHEVWHYDDAAHIQRLERMIALCPACHEVKHFGRAQLAGRAQDALNHLMRVNAWQSDEARAHVRESGAAFKLRSEHEWALDLTALANYGVNAGVFSAAERPRGDTSRRI